MDYSCFPFFSFYPPTSLNTQEDGAGIDDNLHLTYTCIDTILLSGYNELSYLLVYVFLLHHYFGWLGRCTVQSL